MKKSILPILMCISTIISMFIPATIEAQDEELPIIVISECAVQEPPTISECEADPYAEENMLIDAKIAEANLKIEEARRNNNNYDFFMKYIDILEEYSEWIDPPESIIYEFNEKELNMMWQVIETETYTADFDSKIHVANVLLNRIKSERFPDEIDKIIVPGQFASFRKDITNETKLALEYAFHFPDETEGALFFHSGEKTSTFNGANYLFTDNAGHHLYK